MSNLSLFGVRAAATFLGLTAGRVRQLLVTGDLVGQKVGARVWVISAADLARFLRKRRKLAATGGSRPGRPPKALATE